MMQVGERIWILLNLINLCEAEAAYMGGARERWIG
jgi:hypothetical protein